MFDRISEGRYWDKPWSLISGCTPCSLGCEHCWSLAMEKRFSRQPKVTVCDQKAEKFLGQRVFGDIRIHPERLDIPFQRKKPTVWAICNDAFHPSVPFSFINKTFDVMGQSTRHVYLLPTKRISRMAEYFAKEYPLLSDNVWCGITICNQAEADEKIPILLQIPAAVRFISVEPMLGPIEIGDYFPEYDHRPTYGYYRAWLKMQGIESDGKSVLINPGIDWVILGGETSPGARPMKLEWVRDIRDQCIAAEVAFFFKAWGPRKEAGRILDGREWNELPKIN